MKKRQRNKSKIRLKRSDQLLLLIFAAILLMSVVLATYLGLQMASQSQKSSSRGRTNIRLNAQFHQYRQWPHDS